MNTAHYSYTQNASIALSVLMLGIMTGFFWTYSFNINQATSNLSGEHYTVVQSLLNVNVRHAMFFTFFFGTGLLGVVAVLVNISHRGSLTFWLLFASTASYIVGIIVLTKFVNLPLNAYTESWDPQNLPNDWELTRDSWNQANMMRVVFSFLAFTLSLFTLMLRAVSQEKQAN